MLDKRQKNESGKQEKRKRKTDKPQVLRERFFLLSYFPDSSLK